MLQTLLTSIAVILRIVSNPLANVFQKKLTLGGKDPLIVNFITYFLLSISCIFIVLNIHPGKLSEGFWIYSIAGGIAGGVGNGFLVKALKEGQLSILGPINSYKSLVGIIVGIFLLGEIPNIWGVLGIAMIIYGSYFVLGTTDEGFSWAILKRAEIQFRIWAMILTAIEAVFIKKVMLSSNAAMAFISWCVFGTLFAFIFLLIHRPGTTRSMIPASREISRYMYVVILIGIMQLTTIYSFKHMPVGYALALFQLSAIVGVLLGHRIFNEKDIRKKLLGAAIMVTGSVIIIIT